METNDYQIGGNHYQTEYQHWDFVCDSGIHYLLGCATKYVARWRKKNGLEDLRKSLHYLCKAQDMNIFPIVSDNKNEIWKKFSLTLDSKADRIVLEAIYNCDYYYASQMISQMISDIECDATSSYTNQG